MKLLTFLTILLLSTTWAQSQDAKQHFDEKNYIEGEMLVQILANTNLKDIISRAPVNYNLQIDSELSAPMRVWLLKFDKNVVDASTIQNFLYHQPEVTVADYNYYVQMRSTIPGDPQVGSQWHHVNNGQSGGTPDADIDSDLAWDITRGGKTATNDDIVVCMVESSGGNLDHQDLAPNRWINTGEIDGNGIDDDGNGYIDDYNGWNTGQNNDNTGTGGHGTNCLGMIGAKGDNDLNVVGANWDVKLMVVNMGGGLSQSNVIQAYTYPLVLRQQWNNSGGTEGAFVVATSASWGIDNANPNNYPLWCQFYDTLGRYGVINVGATTNSNLDVDVAGDMPTACSSDYMVGVGRTDRNDNTAGGYGDQTINFGAPGINVLTTDGTTGTTVTTGTSFACPLTAGVVGLAYSIPCTDFMDLVVADPQGAADAVLYALNNGVDDVSQLANLFIEGGRLNARNTIDTLMANVCDVNVCNFDIIENVSPPTCAGQDNGSIELLVSGGTPGYTYDWGLNGGNVNNLTSLNPGPYYVVVRDAAGCDTMMSYNLTYDVDLDVSVDITDVSCPGENDGAVNAVATGSSGYSYQWQGGPSTSNWGPLGAGSYAVEVTDVNGCTATSGAVVSAPPSVSVNFAYTDNFLQVAFTNSSTGGPVEWDFGDGTTSNFWVPTHYYTAPGTYSVCLTVFGACDTLTDCQDITVEEDVTSLVETESSQIKLYPNPTTNSATVEISEDLIGSKYSLTDQFGRIIFQGNFEHSESELRLTNIEKGVYYISIENNAELIRLVKY